MCATQGHPMTASWIEASTLDDNESMNNEITSDFTSPILNDPITSEEIKRSVIENRKNNKSPGVDNIINEYIKSTENPMCPLYVKLSIIRF